MPDQDVFIFIADAVEFASPAGFDIVGGARIGPATEEQRVLIRRWLDRLPIPPDEGAMKLHRKYEPDEGPQPERATESAIDIGIGGGAKHWYGVLHLPSGEEIADPDHAESLQLVANILTPDLDFVAWFDHDPSGLDFLKPLAASHVHPSDFSDYWKPSPPKVVTPDLAKMFRELYGRLQLVYAEYPSIFQAIGLLEELRGVARKSHFQFLGLFSVIEALITHKPGNTDVGDSIAHQVRSKVLLLANRGEGYPDHDACFDRVDFKKTWSKLYEYRSCVAHGRIADWSKEFASLGSPGQAQAFLREVTKALLRHALREPQLITDLRGC